jgi:acyl-CoA dehydrogenase
VKVAIMHEKIDAPNIQPSDLASAAQAMFPQFFFSENPSAATLEYLRDPLIQKLVEFFRRKGVAALKEEDRREQWYEDWLAYQSQHGLYAALLTPKQYSTRGGEWNLLKLTRFLEVFGYCSPAHGYSLQVSFLGLFSILMGTNSALKQEAIAELERGGLFAFGVSEKNHGADLLANEFSIKEIAPGRFIANGKKYFIGNANCAAMISILAHGEDRHHANRAPPILFALRPKQSKGFQNVKKIHTLGVRAAFVGEFEVENHELPQSDLIAQGRKAWDAIFGTITLGKFFLGFGQIGICQHAWEEASTHLDQRVLYGKPAIQMPHLRTAVSEAYVRLTAMKLFAYRALDYVQAASAADRRYTLFTAVQKAKVSTQGVKVMSLLSQAIGAKGFESETFFEMALRDAQLIPGLEGSAHINLGMAAQFIPTYFANFDSKAAVPKSLIAGQISAAENSYLMEATTRGSNAIQFPKFLKAFRTLISIPNVRQFAQQAITFARLVRNRKNLLADSEITLAMGECLATIAYAQLIAENSQLLGISDWMISAIFHLLVRDLATTALFIATLPNWGETERSQIRRLIVTPQTRGEDWDFVAKQTSGVSCLPLGR